MRDHRLYLKCSGIPDILSQPGIESHARLHRRAVARAPTTLHLLPSSADQSWTELERGELKLKEYKSCQMLVQLVNLTPSPTYSRTKCNTYQQKSPYKHAFHFRARKYLLGIAGDNF